MINPPGYIIDGIERNENCNGCGLSHGDIIPDEYGDTSLLPACCRHDYRYETGKTEADKVRADLELFCNMLILLTKANTDQLEFAITLLMDRLEKSYTQRTTDFAWKEFFEKVKFEVSITKLNWFRKWVRYNFAKTYYEAVAMWGDMAFYKGKLR
jgi:hypothetical protein